jgi:hypothetical protein
LLDKTDAQGITRDIRRISQYIRFVGVINGKGKLMAYERRHGLKPLLDTKKTSNRFSDLAIETGMAAEFNKQLGMARFIWVERDKVQTISFAIGKNTVWVSIDKNVIRSEILRIIDNCLPIVKRFT